MKHPKIKDIQGLKKGLQQKGSGPIRRLEAAIDDIDLLDWLCGSDEKTRIYYSSRDGNFESAGIGIARAFILTEKGSSLGVVDEIQTLIGSSGMRFYGGISFDADDSPEDLWAPFGRTFFIAPKFEIVRSGQKTIFAINVFDAYNKEDAVFFQGLGASFPDACAAGRDPQEKSWDVLQRTDIPAKSAWMENIEEVLNRFGKPEFKKIVLARKTVLSMEKYIDPLFLFSLLKRQNINTSDYFFQIDAGHTFMGASPELLYCRSGDIIQSEAIAATILRGSNASEDIQNSRELIASLKNRQEYGFVFESVKSDLDALCEKTEVLSSQKVLKLRFLQHIISRFQGNLKKGICDRQILQRLHPTPAVAGFPKKDIQKAIKRYEPFYRGYYSGPVGYLGQEASEFAVALRCALVFGRDISLFAGAGIVEGSDPGLEWNEVENKIKTFLDLLDGCHG